MRIFSTIEEAISEIERDLSRADIVHSTRVQGQTGLDLKTRELINYSYQILDEGMPVTVLDLIDVGREFFPETFDRQTDMEWQAWLFRELSLRLQAGHYLSSIEPVPETFHPLLKTTMEGKHLGYTYPEIMFGAFEVLRANLIAAPDTRRAYFPFFDKHHAIRGPFPTRIPCSLGYQVMIREVPGKGPQLVLIYLQRSSDFRSFWLTDLWFAYRFQEELVKSLQSEKEGQFKDLSVGSLMHTVLSLHSFLDQKEIY